MPECASTPVAKDTLDVPAGPDHSLPELSVAELSPQLASALGRFQIQEILGEGTFGTVYRAHDPRLDRCVALKVAKASVLSAERAERFRREARASAGLRHPNIVPLFESGEAAGQFYLASAYVPGMTLEDALHERAGAGGFAPREAAEIARRLAGALAYAHGQGVVHRDVKSANVMLDQQGEPHLLDFGLALRNEGADRMTLDGSALGTPAYLAPEVATGRRDLWGPATDQYALGVVLYELLTGQTPFAGPVEVVMSLLQTTDPPPPSRVNQAVPRDLEAVCLKCLEKDPVRRYGDCQALADDLRRWLDGESTRARPAGMIERAAKWARRKPAVAALSASVVALLLIGFGLVTWKWIEADRARQSAQKAESDAISSAAAARQSAATAEAVNDFVARLFESATPEKAIGRKVTVEEVLLGASRELGTFAEQPRTDAAVRRTLGNSFRSLGDYERAEPLLCDALAIRRRELGPDHRDTLASAFDWALLLHTKGKLTEAEATFRRLAAVTHRTVGADDPLALKTDDGLALVLQDNGQSKEAEELFRAVLAIRHRVSGDSDPDTLSTMNHLGTLLFKDNRLPEAEELFTQVLTLRTEVLSAVHPKTLESMNNLAVLRDTQGRYPEARKLYEQTLAERRRILGPAHVDTLLTLSNLAQLLDKYDKTVDVAPMFRESIDGMRRTAGPEHPDTLKALNNLAVHYYGKNNLNAAEPILKDVLAIRLRVLPAEHADTLQTRTSLAIVQMKLGKFDEAVPMMRTVWEAHRLRGPTALDTLQSAIYLGYMLLEKADSLASQGKANDAAAALKSAEEVCADLPTGHWLHLDIGGVSGGILMARKKFKEAEPLVISAYEKMKDATAAPLPRKQAARERLIRLYDLTDRKDRVAELRAVPR